MNVAVSRRSLLRGAAATGGLLLAGCAAPAEGGAPTASATTVPVTACGRDLTFAAPPQRIVSFYPAMTELLLALELDARIAGQVNTDQSPPSPAYAERYAKVKVLAAQEPSVEVLLSARPDLIVADAAYHFDGKQLPTVEDLAAKGIVVYLNASFCEGRKVLAKVGDADIDLANLGRVFGVEAKAKEIGERGRASIADTAARLSGRPPVRCALVTVYDKALYADAGGLYTDVLTLAGGRNVTEQSEMPAGEYYAQVSPETIARKNPDVIVHTYLDDAGRASAQDYLRRTFADTTAVRTGRVIATPEATFGGALRSVDGVAALARQLHPDAF
ncbi:ABC transporter substrate-binding protein [Dactylosporangium sp. CA-233914]|uniref:ABC transporter substrate-binding protein n=1 Tax=Dactylosporangium sp. CA-233914 TaxID=3239934 RepID=UPI003D8FB880